MSISAWFLVAVALSILVLQGWALVTLLAPDARLWWFERASFSFLLGVGFGSLAWVTLMPVYGIIQPRIALTCVAAGLVALAWRRPRASRERDGHTRGLHWLSVVGCCLLFVQSLLLLAVALHTPLGWDALFNWEFKARLAFEHQPQGQLPFTYFSDVSRAWSHPRYPLAVPFVEFWIYSWLGHLDQAVVKVAFPIFFYAMVAATCGAVRRLTGNGWMAAAAGVALGFIPPLTAGPGAVTGYADVPLAAAITAAASCALVALSTSRIEMFMLAASLTCVAAWTKTEGLMLALCLGSAVAVSSTWISRRSPVSKVPLWAATAMVWLPLVVVCPWLMVQARYGMPEADFPSMSPGVGLANLHRLPAILTLMTSAMLKPGRWGLLWPAFAAGCALAVSRRQLERADLVLAAMVIVPFFGYAVIFLFSGWESVAQHVGVSIERLLTPLAPAALVFSLSRAWLLFT